MAFRKKAHYILAHKPDIIVVPECEHPDKLIYLHKIPKPTDTLWFGKNQHKGLAIFSYSDYRFNVADNHNRQFEMIIPVAVTNGNFNFNLFAVWANNPTDPDGQYIEQVWKAIHYYENQLTGTETILIGDFNSNTIWDRKRRVSNHSNVVKYLEERNIFSVYHKHHKQPQGSEKHPTLFLYRHKDKPYHLDYCFASAGMIDKLASVKVGRFSHWAKHSDHMPIIVTFNIP
jgi:exodeoxyribonuclease-3